MKAYRWIAIAGPLAALLIFFFLASAWRPVSNRPLFPADKGRAGEPAAPPAAAGARLEPAPAPEPVGLVFFGDLMIDRHVREKIDAGGVDFLFRELSASPTPLFYGQYELAGANLEGAVTVGGRHYSPEQMYDFAFRTDDVARLGDYGFNFFNLANNHFSDQGKTGEEETRANLHAAGFHFCGARDGLIDQDSTTTVVIEGRSIGFLGLSAVYTRPETRAAVTAVAALAEATDFTVVNAHWGEEYEHRFNGYQQTLARALIEAGADVIIGHHPHVVQGMEIHRGRPVFYSLGNFIFDQYFSPDTQTGLAVGIELGGGTMDIVLYPLWSRSSQPALMTGEENAAFFRDFAGWSELTADMKNDLSDGRLVLPLSI